MGSPYNIIKDLPFHLNMSSFYRRYIQYKVLYPYEYKITLQISATKYLIFKQYNLNTSYPGI